MPGVLVEDGAPRTGYDEEFNDAMAKLDAQAAAGDAGATPPADPGAVPSGSQPTAPPTTPPADPGVAPAAKGTADPSADPLNPNGEDRASGLSDTAAPADASAPAEGDKGATKVIVIGDDLAAVLPETVKDMAGVVEYIKDLDAKYKDEKSTTEDFADFLSDNPLLFETIQEMRREGKSFFDVAPKVLGAKENEPIPEPGTKEYADYVKRQITREEAIKAQKKADEEAERQYERVSSHATNMRESFRKANPDISDGDWRNFVDYVRVHTYGDAKTGLLPNDTFPMWWKSYTFDKAREKARLAGKSEGIKEVTKLKTPVPGDGMPHFQGGKPSAPATDDLASLESSLRPTRLFEP